MVSRLKLPKAETGALQDDDMTDPRTELVRQLLEYKKYKDAANLLDAAAGGVGSLVEDRVEGEDHERGDAESNYHLDDGEAGEGDFCFWIEDF